MTITELARSGRRAPRDDRAFTAVELIMAMTIMAILLVITIPLVDTIFAVSNGITTSYATVNRVLPSTTVLERLIGSAVDPGPSLGQNSEGAWVQTDPSIGGTPSPAFAPVTLPTQASPPAYLQPSSGPFSIGSNYATFYSYVGDANGPELITATTDPVAGSTNFDFVVTATPANPGSCPTVANLAANPNGTLCTYSPGNAKRLVNIDNVVNGSPTSPTPIFQFSTDVPTTQNGGIPSVTPVTTLNGGGSCTSASCPANQISYVHIDIQTAAGKGASTSFDTWVSIDGADHQSLTTTAPPRSTSFTTSAGGGTAQIDLTPVGGGATITVDISYTGSQATLSWSAPGSYAITYCTTSRRSICTSSPISEEVSFSPTTVTGLTSGQDYLFTVEQDAVAVSSTYSEEVG